VDVRRLHAWNLSYPEATQLQRELAGRLEHPPLQASPELVAGADVSFSRRDPVLHAGVVVLRLPELETVEERWVSREVAFPYVPGFLSFREIPPLVEVFEGLEQAPGAVICDGQGIAHPRGLGLAAHLGLLLQVPTVGCAKSRFVGEHEEPGTRRGAQAPLWLDGRQVGVVLRSRDGVKPLWVSPGHGVDLEGAVRLVEACLGRYRLPETTRRADALVNRVRKAAQASRGGEDGGAGA